MTGLNFNPTFNSNPYYDFSCTPNQFGYGYPNSVDSWFSNANTSVGDTFVSSGNASDDYARFVKKNKLKNEAGAKAHAVATANDAKMKQLEEELKRNGLGLTDEQKKYFMSAVGKMLDAQNHSFKDDMMMYTTMPLITEAGLHPVQNIRTSIGGHNTGLFSMYKDLGKSNKANRKILEDARTALRDAERFSQRKSRGYDLTKSKSARYNDIYNKMHNEMSYSLKELRAAENELAKATNEELKNAARQKVANAQQKVKNITEAINKTNSRTSGFLTRLKNKTGFGKRVTINTETFTRELEAVTNASKQATTAAAEAATSGAAGSAASGGAAAVQNVTNASGVISKTASTVGNGLKVAGKGVCKFAKKGWLVAAFEVYNDKDRLKKAWGEDTKTGLKQTGQTAVKATCVTAGVLAGMKAGAAIGTCIGGPIGTAIGFVAGAIIGGIGAWLGRKVAKTVVGQDVADKIKTEEANKPSEKQIEIFQQAITWGAQNQDKLTQEEIAVLDQIYSGLNPEQQATQ